MLPRNHLINSRSVLPQNILTTSSVYHPSVVNKQEEQKQKLRRRKTTTIISTITTTSLFSVNTTNINSSFSSSTSSTQQQQISFEDPYSAKTGIKTAALLGGMLLLVILYLIWKSRARLCRSCRSSRPSSAGIGNSRLSASKFDLDYWLKQVDLLEAKEATRHRGGQSLYLELPRLDARDNHEATASWIVDTYRHWRFIQYRQQQQVLQQNETQQTETNLVPYRRQRNLIRRFVRRFFTSPRQRSSFSLEHSQSLIAGMRPSIVSNNFIPPPLSPSLQPRRTASWPRLKSNQHQAGAPMSALQTHLARKRLLRRTSRNTFDI